MRGELLPTMGTYLNDVKDHKLAILMDNGLYRHMRWGRPDSSIYMVQITTWPGHLAVTGDMGSFVFSRVHDMFTFFRSPDMKINPGYWSVKIVAEDKHGGVEKFSVEKFHEAVLCHTRDYLDLEEGAEIPEDIMDEIDPLVETYDEYDCVEAMLDFYSDRIKFDDFWEHNLKEYNYCYIWCLYAIVHVISRYDDVSGSAQAVA